MITLYHFPRAICAQKVRLALAEKQLHFESRLVAPEELRSVEYLKLNAGGYVPTLVHDGNILTESRTINEYLNDAFSEPELMPREPLERAMVRNWCKKIDDSLHLNVFILSFVVSFRQGYLSMPDAAKSKALPLNPIKRMVTLDLAENGDGSKFFSSAVEQFLALLVSMEAALSRTAWLVGDEYSLADLDYTPYLRRLEELGLWQLVRHRFPRTEDWFANVTARTSYSQAITAWETEEDRAKGETERSKAQPIFAELAEVS